MTNKERLTRFMKREPIDRVPFVQYDNIGADNDLIWETVGRDKMGISAWTMVHRHVTPNCSISTEQITMDGKVKVKNTLRTPIGDLHQLKSPVPGIPKVLNTDQHFVRTISDYRILLYYLNDIEVVENRQELIDMIAYLGDDGVPHIWIGRTPYQELWVNWVSITDLSMHMYDDPSLMETVLGEFGNLLLRNARTAAGVAEDLAFPYIVIGDNLTAPLIGPQRFADYCVPYYRQVADMFDALDIPLAVHMDGDLKPLWDQIGNSGVAAIDSFSPPPDNDTSAADAVAMWPDMLIMMNFPSSVHLLSEEEIYQKTVEILAEAGNSGRLQIQISENPPPGCWRKSYPQIIRAIDDFFA